MKSPEESNTEEIYRPECKYYRQDDIPVLPCSSIYDYPLEGI